MKQQQRREAFQNIKDIHVMVWTAEQTAAFLRKDSDTYVNTMSQYDLSARKVSSYTDYINKIAAGAYTLSQSEAETVFEAIREVDTYLSKASAKTVPSRIKHIPWIIAVTRDRTYEDGFPHTRENVIFITPTVIRSASLASTLLHEKVHVYQRTYPAEMDAWIEQRGFTRWKTRKSEPYARANPDLDDWIYIDPVSSKPMVATYTSDTPKSINDVKLSNPAFEHPYELMAYEIAEKLVPA
jgi:hypothetical protein